MKRQPCSINLSLLVLLCFAFWITPLLSSQSGENPLSPIEKPVKYNVRDFGAMGNGNTLDTDAINLTIETCSEEGGGIVYLPPGIYLSGSIHLKSNITLFLDTAATILGAPNNIHAYDPAEPNQWDQYQDFGHSHFQNALIWGENLENIAIIGKGTIKGGGMTRSNKVPDGGGDKAISLKLCKNIRVEDITIKQGGHFAFLANGCDDVVLKNLSVATQRDGFNIISCKNVEITDCRIESVRYEDDQPAGGDDAIALKSDYALGYERASENITIKNCTLKSGGANGIQIGSETVGDFKNIHFSNLKILGAEKAGIGITSNDGAVIDGLTISDITMEKVCTPIYILVSSRLRRPDPSETGHIRNITFKNITAVDVFGYVKKRGPWTSTITGIEDCPVVNIRFENIHITYKGGGKSEWSEIDPPEQPENYSPRYLGIRPAYGFYCRYVKDVTFSNINLKYENEDHRPAFVFENSEDIFLEEIETMQSESAGCTIVIEDINNFSMRNFENLPDVSNINAHELKY